MSYQSYRTILFNALEYGEKLTFHCKQGDKVALILPNSIEYLVTYLACTLHGLTYIPIPHFLSATEINSYLELFQPKLIVTDRNDLTGDFFPPPHNSKNVFDSQVFSNRIDRLPFTKEDDIESIYLSSGSTGKPKGIMYSYGNKYALIESIVKGFQFTNQTRHLAFLPFGHTASLNYSVFPSLFCGSYLLNTESFQNIRTSFFKTISKFKISYVQTVPTVISALLMIRENIENLNLESILFIGCGSAPLSKSVQEKFYETFQIKLANLYGLSETGPTHFDDPTNLNWEPGSVGKPLSVNECKINNDGEILIKGKNVFLGYYKDEASTQESFFGEWFKTGDYGKIINGVLYFSDRKKDMIIIGGINVYPAEIENVIKQIKKIDECLVFGVEDKILNNKIVAYINSSNLNLKNENIEKAKIVEHCRSQLSEFKIPSEIYFVKELPKTPSGKLLRRIAKENYKKLIDI